MLDTEYAYNDHLKELHASEFEMADGEPDIRNWKVIGLQNQEVGKVTELIFDEISRRVRYLIVQINGKPLNLISRSVIVPVGLADLLTDEKVVLLSGFTIRLIWLHFQPTKKVKFPVKQNMQFVMFFHRRMEQQKCGMTLIKGIHFMITGISMTRNFTGLTGRVHETMD